jgi:very-short-patch-repair endonuclease
MTDTQASQRHAGQNHALAPSTATQGRERSTEAPARSGAPTIAPASEIEAILANRMAMAGLPEPETQFRFCPPRRWRADFAYPAAMLLIEADGGTWTAGRHVRGKGFEADCEKTSTAAAIGWRVIRVTREMIEDGRAVALIRRALEVPV